MKFLYLAPILLLPALPAQAATPEFLPSQDVTITYELDTPGHPTQNYQLSYDAADELARIDNPAQGIYILANLPTGQAQVVIPALHATVQAPDFSSLTQLVTNADNAQFTPLGPARYAGMDCEKYLVLNAQGSGTACITHDGVVLHFSGKDAQGSAEITALSVNFAPQPAQNFSPPPGFAAITLPPSALAALLQPQ